MTAAEIVADYVNGTEQTFKLGTEGKRDQRAAVRAVWRAVDQNKVEVFHDAAAGTVTLRPK